MTSNDQLLKEVRDSLRAIDERVRQMEIASTAIGEKVINLAEDVENLDKRKVSCDRYSPLEKIVWGLVLIVLTGVVGGVVTYMMNKNKTEEAIEKIIDVKLRGLDK